MIGRVLALVGGLAGAGSLSQFPEYAQQYTQRVGGAHDEAARQVAQYQDIANQFGLDLEGLVARFTANQDPVVAAFGAAVDEWLARERYLRAHLDQLQGGPLRRMSAVATARDPEIAGRAWEAFRPAMPITGEGLTHALVGFFAGYLGVAGLGRTMRRRRLT